MGRTALGVDFGTTTTLAARPRDASSATIPLGPAHRWMPTLVAVDRDLRFVVGEKATASAERSVIRSIKSRLLSGEQSIDVTTPDGVGRSVDVDDVVHAVLKEAAARIEQRTDLDVIDGLRARFGCPAVWTAGPRQRLAAIAAKAGFDLDVADILDEPIAAGISWVMGRFARGQAVPDGRVVVFDCGGGTLDVATIEVRPGTPPEITVLSAAGHAEAGDALDTSIAADLRVDLRTAGVDVESDDRATELERLLRLAAQRLKEQLTTSMEASTEVGGGFEHIPTLRYERTRLETVFGPQLDHAVRVVFACLRAAELRKRGLNDAAGARNMSNEALARDVAYVLLVGGMSRVPAVATRLSAEFPVATVETDPGVASPEESVVNGLTFDDVVSELNLHRPGFDFVVRLTNRDGVELDQEVVYPAYSPLYTPAEVALGGFRLGYDATVRIPSGASVAKLSCTDVDGKRLELHVDGERTNELDISTGYRPELRFKLYVDGTIVVSAAQHRTLRVERWPVLRSGHVSSPIVLRTADRNYEDDLQPGWWGERL